MINANLELDAIKLVIDTMDEILSDHEFAYPINHIDEDRAHTALCNIRSRAETLKAVMYNLKPVPTGDVFGGKR